MDGNFLCKFKIPLGNVLCEQMMRARAKGHHLLWPANHPHVTRKTSHKASPTTAMVSMPSHGTLSRALAVPTSEKSVKVFWSGSSPNRIWIKIKGSIFTYLVVEGLCWDLNFCRDSFLMVNWLYCILVLGFLAWWWPINWSKACEFYLSLKVRNSFAPIHHNFNMFQARGAFPTLSSYHAKWNILGSMVSGALFSL